MDKLSLLFSIVLIHGLAVMSPGPDFFLSLKNSLQYSRKTGIYTALGFALGILVHITYSMAGVALIISKSTALYATIRYAGAAYLIYLGFHAIMDKQKEVDLSLQKTADIGSVKAISQGFITNILNPKATLFFMSLYTYIFSAGINGISLYVISAIFVLHTFLWFCIVAYFFTQKKIQKMYYKRRKVLSYILGGFLIFIGIKILISH